MEKEFKLFLIIHLEERDLEELALLFYKTVHAIKDYNQVQIDAWAPKDIDFGKWRKRISKNYLFIARDNDKIIGFGELAPSGYINMLYVHKDYLRQGIGKELLDVMIEKAQELDIDEIFTEASITAKPFFESQEFKIVKKQIKSVNGVDFINYLMKKEVI
jgi:N-acetylglutamate synthase-like GNAT family acetyltransferase